MEFPGKRAKLTLTLHLISPLVLGQAMSGAETQSVPVSVEALALSDWAIIMDMDPQSSIEAFAWLSATFDIANTGPLITRSSDSKMEMIGRFFADILISSTKLWGYEVGQTTPLSVPMILAFFYFNNTTRQFPKAQDELPLATLIKPSTLNLASTLCSFEMLNSRAI